MPNQGSFTPSVFILDVDGVMTDGSFLYDNNGKFAKRFGADDHDALSLLKKHLDILFVTGDHRGFDISHKRIAEDMKIPLELVSTVDRLSWINSRYDPATAIYMGDGIFDAFVFQGVGYAITVADALDTTKQHADFVTSRTGGNRAVAEATLHILATFFEPFDPATAMQQGMITAGHWKNTSQTRKLRETATTFFAEYAAKRLTQLPTLLSDDVVLHDGDRKGRGKQQVLAELQAFFSTTPPIGINITKLHEKVGGLLAELAITRVSCADLSAIFNLDFDSAGKIVRIDAFYGVAA